MGSSPAGRATHNRERGEAATAICGCNPRVSTPLDAADLVDDASEVAVYDKLHWHLSSAMAGGQPPENAFAHIGFYLAWLIRHDLHDPRAFPSVHIESVKQGQMTGTDLADDIDTKLISQAMNAEGRAFSDARYSAYMSEYASLFKDLPDYGVADEPGNYKLVEQVLDRLYADWVSEDRPKPAAGGDLPLPTSISAMFPPGFSQEQMDTLLRDWQTSHVELVPPPTDEQMPHVAPDLEALIPRDLASPPMRVSSVRATEWGSSLLNRALRRLEVRPRDAVVVSGLGGSEDQTLTVSIYGVPGVRADRLESEFSSVIFLLPGSKWQRREITGREVNWALGREFTVAYWAREGLVLHVAGEADAVERAITRIP